MEKLPFFCPKAESLRQDLAFLIAAVEFRPQALRFVDAALQQDPDFLYRCVAT